MDDEPISPNRPVDYRYLYGLIENRAEREEDHGRSVDAMLTALLAGVVAFIGFSFRLSTTPWSAAAAVVYLIPSACC